MPSAPARYAQCVGSGEGLAADGRWVGCRPSSSFWSGSCRRSRLYRRLFLQHLSMLSCAPPRRVAGAAVAGLSQPASRRLPLWRMAPPSEGSHAPKTHVAGEKLFVNVAGDTMPLCDDRGQCTTARSSSRSWEPRTRATGSESHSRAEARTRGIRCRRRGASWL